MPTLPLDAPLPLIVLGAVFAIVGLSHVRLHWHGRTHVRFGLFSLGACLATLVCASFDHPVVRILPYGLALAVFAGSHALSRQMRRSHAALVARRAELESGIAAHTAALAERSRELTEAGAAQARFLASISHEIRTPLNGILGVNRMLLKSLAAGAERDLAEVVQSQGRSLLAIINDILDYSKIEAGRFALDPADFSLRRAINDTARVYGEQARGKGLEFVLDVDDAVPYRVHGDGMRLRQIVDNLLANAVKFTERGSVTLRVRADGTTVRFEIADTGIGVDDATLAGLFQPFTQGDSSTTRRYGGTGLGLAIAKSLVEMMGGTIGASGERGRGSRFWIVAPLGAAQLPAGPLTPRGPRTPMSGVLPVAHVGHALLAEDNAINRMVTVALLQDAGWTADVATNGVEAVEAFERRTYDLVLMDCRMPALDGYDAAAQMRRHETDGRRTPIVALTAHAFAGEADRCRAAGMDDYLTKPISGGLLAEVLERWRPAVVAPAAGPALDPGVLDDLGRRSSTLLRQLLEHYLGSIPAEVGQLCGEVHRGETERISARAHDLAGSALLVGARELARRLRRLETPDAETRGRLPEAMAEVEDEHRRVLEALGTRLGTLPPTS
jgi:signal transduction histidine kinase/CheY-like chemotaxis protein/HPt (histidine-containing phosphotransfer) domain-containing protein